MNRTVFFADKAVAFTAEAPGGAWYVVAAEADGGISRAKILNFLESHNSVAVVSPDPDAVYAAFAAEFTPVEAAGGVVVNEYGEWLMIHRNGRWDLPKGHLECGERIEECAAREVEEETGVAARVVRPLCETLHAYYFPKTKRWELKRTHWYELNAPAASNPTPQTEEGIDDAAWFPPESVERCAAGCFPTVRTVLAELGACRTVDHTLESSATS